MTYPTLSPSSRTYSHGDWPVSNHRFMTGRSQRTLHANAKTQQTLKLTYENQPLEDFDAVLLHYEQQQGTNKAFNLPEIALFEGWDKEGQDDALLGSIQLWRYNSEPRIRSRRGGLGTLEVDLITSLQQAERLYDCPTSREIPSTRTAKSLPLVTPRTTTTLVFQGKPPEDGTTEVREWGPIEGRVNISYKYRDIYSGLVRREPPDRVGEILSFPYDRTIDNLPNVDLVNVAALKIERTYALKITGCQYPPEWTADTLDRVGLLAIFIKNDSNGPWIRAKIADSAPYLGYSGAYNLGADSRYEEYYYEVTAEFENDPDPDPEPEPNPDDPSNNPHCPQYIEDLNPEGSPLKRYVIGTRFVQTGFDLFDCTYGNYAGSFPDFIFEGDGNGLDPIYITARSIKVSTSKVWQQAVCLNKYPNLGPPVRDTYTIFIEAQRADGSWRVVPGTGTTGDFEGIYTNQDSSTSIFYRYHQIKYILADNIPLDIQDGIPNPDGSCGELPPDPDPDPGPGPNPNPLPPPPEDCGGGGGGGGGITQPQPPINPPISRPPIIPDDPDDPGNGGGDEDSSGGPGEGTLVCPLGYKDNGFGKCVVDLEAEVGGYMRWIEGRGTTVPAYQAKQQCAAAPLGASLGPAGGYDFRVPYGPYDITETNPIESQLDVINAIRGYRIGVSWKSDGVEDSDNVVIPLDGTINTYLNASASSSRWGLNEQSGRGVGAPIDSPVSDFYQEQIAQGLFDNCVVRRGCISGFDGTPNKCNYTYKVGFLPIGYINTVVELYPDYYSLSSSQKRIILMDLFCGGAKNQDFIAGLGSASTLSITPVSVLNTTPTQTFPNISPSRRNITYGDWTINRFGSEQEVTLPLPSTAKKSDVIMDLVFANREDSVARSFLQHYDGTSGTFNNFSVADINPDKGTFAGWDGPISDNISKGRWVYANAPRVVSVHPGFSTTTVRLINLEPELIDNSNSHAFTDSICPGYGSDTGGGEPRVTSYQNTEELLRRFNLLNTRSTIDRVLPSQYPDTGPFPPGWNCETPIPGLINISTNNFGNDGSLAFIVSSKRYFSTKEVIRCNSNDPVESIFGPSYSYSTSLSSNADAYMGIGNLSSITSSQVRIGPWTDACSWANSSTIACLGGHTGENMSSNCDIDEGIPTSGYYCRRLVLRAQWEEYGEPACKSTGVYGSNLNGLGGGTAGTYAHFNVITQIIARVTVTENGRPVQTDTAVYGPVSTPENYSESFNYWPS